MVWLREWRECVRASRNRPVDPVDSLPMYLLPHPTPEIVRLNRQNRVLLLFLSYVLLGSTLMPAMLIWDHRPTFIVQAATMFGWPCVLMWGFVIAAVPLLPFIWQQYRDPHGPLRRKTSRLAQLGMLMSAIGWVILSVSSWRIDGGWFIGTVIFQATVASGFAYVVADSLNNELIIFGERRD